MAYAFCLQEARDTLLVLASYTVQQTIAGDFQRTYPISIYQEAGHRELAGLTSWLSFFLVQTRTGKIFAETHFHMTEQRAVARPAAPFAGIAFDPHLPVAALQQFIAEVEAQLRQRGCNAVTILHPPAPYQKNGDLVLSLLHDVGYNRMRQELVSVISVDKNDLSTRLTAWEQRKLTQARMAGLQTVRLPLDRLPDVYEFLQTCRAERGYTLSMTKAQVLELAAAFPQAIRLYAATQNNNWVAAVLAIQDHTEVLYTFYYGHLAEKNNLSPVVLLIHYVYSDCQAIGLKYLNLGTSTLHGVTNIPLLQFKLQLVATPLQRVTLTKTLS
jgi:hypothetical protein